MANSSKAIKLANKAPSARLAAVVSTAYDGPSSKHNVGVHHSKELKRDQREEIWKLYETNMRDLTESSSFGWDSPEKRKELFHSRSRYILVKESATNDLLAFTHFRFEAEDDEELIYCYELQVAPSAQGMGLGKKLLLELEKLCVYYNMEKIMLTVLKANVKAVGFYEFLGQVKFQMDPASPDFLTEDEKLDPDYEPEDVDYLILSKSIT